MNTEQIHKHQHAERRRLLHQLHETRVHLVHRIDVGEHAPGHEVGQEPTDGSVMHLLVGQTALRVAPALVLVRIPTRQSLTTHRHRANRLDPCLVTQCVRQPVLQTALLALQRVQHQLLLQHGLLQLLQLVL